MLSKLHIDKSSFTEVEAPFDLATFVAGVYDVRPAFVYDEPVSLDLKHVQYTLIRPSDFGVKFMGTVYFTRRKFAEENPELVQKFINSVAQGWNAALKNPSQAIRYLKDFDGTIDENRELQSLIKSKSYFEGYQGQPLRIDPSAWTETMQNLRMLGVVKQAPSASAVEMRFVDKFYSGQK
jgi:ABC-type nitrate/sulfonate/bicarbonate transport system substrate-binding protein